MNKFTSPGYSKLMKPFEEGNDLGGMDDDFLDPDDPTTQLNTPPDAEAAAKAAEEEAAAKAAEEAAAAAAAATKDKAPRQPSRAERRIQQLNERNAALERQLAQRTGDATVAKNLTDLEAHAVELERKYHAALMEDPKEASNLLRQIRATDRDIARIEAQAEAEATVNERFETRDLQKTVAEITAKYEQLSQDSDEYDQELVNEINAVYTGLLTLSSSKSAAMRRAVQIVMGEKPEAKAAGLGTEDPAAATRASREKAGRERTVDTLNRQPPTITEKGQGQQAPVKAIPKTIRDLDKYTEEELAELRGDNR